MLSGHHPDWLLVGMAPGLGIRESYRLKARKILTLNDVLINNGRHSDCAIAKTDHPIDVHGMNIEHLSALASVKSCTKLR